MARIKIDEVFIQRSLILLFKFFLVVLVVYVFKDLIDYQRTTKAKQILTGEAANTKIANQVDSVLNEIMVIASEITKDIEAHDYTKEQLNDLLEFKSNEIKFILGTTVAFEPYMFDKSIKLYAPYYDKNKKGVMDIGRIYDYTNDNLATARWYSKVALSGEAKWSEPYYAEGAQLIVSDYGFPMFKEVDGKKVLFGTVTLTIALENLNKYLHSISLGSQGYAFLTSKSGTYIAHPESNYILNHNLRDIGKKINIDQYMDDILNKDKGSIRYISTYTKVDSYMFYSTVPASDWRCIVVLAAHDLESNTKELGSKIINLSLGVSLFVLFALMFFVKNKRNTHSKHWTLSSTMALLLIFNIALVWFLNIKQNYAAETSNAIHILNKGKLDFYMKDENTRLAKLGKKPFIPVYTGIYIEEMEFKDSYNISVRGRIWEKWTPELIENNKPDFQFAQQSPGQRIIKELISTKWIEEEGCFVYLWEFGTVLRLPLSYFKYPFDSRSVNMEITYPDLHTNIILVPDINGYEVLNPSAFPGMNKKIYFPQATLISSYFSLDKMTYLTDFGNTGYSGDNTFPVMEFNVNLKRRFLNAFVTNIIPIFVVASMIFLIFYSNSRNKDVNTGVSMMGVIQSCAGFFFVLLIAHIDLRRRIASPDITYLETFYFTMYIMIGLLAINVVAFTKVHKSKWLHYHDNLLVKLAYWPFLLGSWLTITLIRFYH